MAAETDVHAGRVLIVLNRHRLRIAHILGIRIEPGLEAGLGVPGAHQWILAPRKMAWQGFTLGQLCEQVKDPERNGGRTLEEIVEHMSEDDLVGWGWTPGTGRAPAPGSQRVFGELIAAWVESGASCPE